MEEFLNYLDEVQGPIEKQVSEYRKVEQERENAFMNTYGIANPAMRVALLGYEAINILKLLSSKCNSIEEMEKIARSIQEEDKDNTAITRAIEFIENFKELKNNKRVGK